MSSNNIFDIDYKQLLASRRQDLYQKVKKLLRDFFPKDTIDCNYQQLIQAIADDIVVFQLPAAQTTVEIHNKSLNSWPDFIATTLLSHLQKDNNKIFELFQTYQSHYHSLIHEPIYKVLQFNSKKKLYRGNADHIALMTSQIFNALQMKKMSENNCLQIDVQFTLHTFSIDNDEEIDESDDDEDEAYKQQMKNFNDAAEKKIEKRNNFEGESFPEHEIADVIRNIQAELSTNPYSYTHAILYDTNINDDYMTKVITKHQVPHCEFSNSALCRIFNAIKSLDKTNNNMLTISFHAMADCIRMYCFCVSQGKVFGSRIFEEDLYSSGIVTSLFENSTISNNEEVQQNMMSGKIDKIYQQYVVLLKRNTTNIEEKVEEIMAIDDSQVEQKELVTFPRDSFSSSINSQYIECIYQTANNHIKDAVIAALKQDMELQTSKNENNVLKQQLQAQESTNTKEEIDENGEIEVVTSNVKANSVNTQNTNPTLAVESESDQATTQLLSYAEWWVPSLFGMYQLCITFNYVSFYGNECSIDSAIAASIIFALAFVVFPIIIFFGNVWCEGWKKAAGICVSQFAILYALLCCAGDLTLIECLIGEDNIGANKAMYSVIRIVPLVVILSMEFIKYVKNRKKNKENDRENAENHTYSIISTLET